MNLSELLSKGLIERFQSNQEQIENQMKIAMRDVSSAKNMLQIGEWEWAYNAAYNAMLGAGRALMFSKGYRARSHEHHIAVIEFVRAVYSSKFDSEVLDAFNKARHQRNESLYDKAGSISQSQSKRIVEFSEIFVKRAAELLTKT
jgi:uncharacterized protein (UPF0332 family)